MLGCMAQASNWPNSEIIGKDGISERYACWASAGNDNQGGLAVV